MNELFIKTLSQHVILRWYVLGHCCYYVLSTGQRYIAAKVGKRYFNTQFAHLLYGHTVLSMCIVGLSSTFFPARKT